MSSRIVALSALILALPLFAAASAVPRTDPVNQCNPGSVQCCNSVKEPKDSKLLGNFNLPIGLIKGLVGENCSPIDLIGVGGGNSCNTQPVCCTNNSFNGVIALGCTPININV
ncbi:fungal hydrophobin-domain-containing protein [Collybia nuda]|uniref:Hydrophobin n=1 Tax=Collybia nuda TaxID=64659 RepID=A0A9P6CPR4_9AGAR|nr:fungal hydrophobin-domain-containing protein [Collybia nuda]